MALFDPLSQSHPAPTQNQLASGNSLSARSLPIKEVCEYAGISMTGPDSTPVSKVHWRLESETIIFHPWQPSAIAWVMAQEGIPIRSGILVDACVLGKTLSALCLTCFATMRKAQTHGQERTQRVKYRPSIIIVLASVIMQWVDQIDHLLKQKRNVMIFWGNSEHVSDTSRKERTVKYWDARRTNLGGLDVDDPETGCTVVITSYQTWA
ncbi:SNF2-related protein [Penicillium subrubescens]|uniref:SNF2 N-terminal domain-containing protein n=1 Tax=Penicillium subrubescens TaxID=1316194 RepID=A0A1Q5TJQ8_9EURO|nr:SNF2-related protein [Penicillium subrubescens]KAJ5891604.1 SNF2-related protein [Penicillium subrubescens]OKP00457.1 hypothetical protein PENSUB_7914 [Penicillium subrubescens]